jgi:hypothetical protein
VSGDITDAVFNYSCFEIFKNDIRYENGLEEICNPHYEVKAKKFASCVLKYEHTFSCILQFPDPFYSRGKVGLKEHFWAWLGPRLENLTY